MPPRTGTWYTLAPVANEEVRNVIQKVSVGSELGVDDKAVRLRRNNLNGAFDCYLADPKAALPALCRNIGEVPTVERDAHQRHVAGRGQLEIAGFWKAVRRAGSGRILCDKTGHQPLG